MTIRARVLFRVAAGPRTGFGHLVRCCNLARAMGVPPVVSLRGSSAAASVAVKLGCRLAVAATALATAEVVVVDDPIRAQADRFISRAYRAGTRVVAIRDLGAPGASVDLVVDGSITSQPSCQPHLLAGPRFTLLSPSIVVARATRAGRTRLSQTPRILIALGGGRQVLAAAVPLVREIRRQVPHAAVDVVSGFSAGSRRPLPPGARWIARQSGLARDLARCDVAVVAGGMTLYEACAVGAPTVAAAVVPAQRPAIAAFGARGAVVDAGSIGTGPGGAEKVGAAVAMLMASRVSRAAHARVARRTVDGRGARRVGQMLRALAQRGRHV